MPVDDRFETHVLSGGSRNLEGVEKMRLKGDRGVITARGARLTQNEGSFNGGIRGGGGSRNQKKGWSGQYFQGQDEKRKDEHEEGKIVEEEGAGGG